MKTFFAIIKTDADHDCSVTLITRETIMTTVERECGKVACADSEADAAGVHGKALSYLSSKFQLVKFYDYTVPGAQMFLAGARGVGPIYELRAVQMVEEMRDRLSRMIDQSLNEIRAGIIQNLSTAGNTKAATSHMHTVRTILDASTEELLKLL